MKRVRYIITKIEFILILFGMFSAASTAQTKAEKIEDLLNKYHEYRLFNGSVLVAENGKIIFEKGFGFANIEWKIGSTPDTKFRIGSITKQFTAMAVLQLVEEGKINLSDKITAYLPNYRKDTGDKVTVHNLLTHTSGIPNYTSYPGFWSDSLRNHYTLDQLISKFCSGDLEFEPGTRMSYSNSGYVLLGKIIENVSGKTFKNFLKERIFEPAGMNNTGIDSREEIINKRASGYDKTITSYKNSKYIYMPNAFGAGNIYSTVKDMSMWDKALYSDKLLPDSLKQKMFTPFLSNYAYGWMVDRIANPGGGDSLLSIWHTGGINGFNTLIDRIVTDKYLIVLFNNTTSAPLREISKNIINILYNAPFNYPKKSIAEYLYQLINDEGIEVAVSMFPLLQKEEGESFTFSEREMNDLGYALLNKGSVDEAIAIFKLNAESYPESFNVYDSMAEAYMIKGEKETAVENYRKSLEINPGNKNAVDMLKKLGVEYKSENVIVPHDILEKYIGEYELMPNFIITIRLDGDKLMSQATGQAEFQIFPLSNTKFYYKVVNAQIEFSVNDKGQAESLTLFQGGKEMPAKKIK